MTSKKYHNNILILFAHPSLQKSRVNKRLIEHISDIDGVTFHDLYEAYPDYHIHVRHEQTLIMQNDIVVFQHPVYWFNMPALLKEWQDLVLVHGWAFGKGGIALRGKKLLSVISTGGRESSYSKEGLHRYSINEYLRPVEQTAYLCGMDFLPPFVVHGTHMITEEEIARHGEDYRKLLTALRDAKVDLGTTHGLSRINADLQSIIKEEL